MTPAILQFVISALLIVAAGTVLTRCADAIAESTGLGRLVVGTVFLGAATSLPELSVDISAVRMNLPNMAVGDLFGSCLFNLLILAVVDLFRRTPGGMLSRSAAAHALSGANAIVLAAVVGIFLLFERLVDFGGIFGFSLGSLIVVPAYLFGLRLTYFDQRMASARIAGETSAEELAGRRWPLKTAIIGYVGAAIAILVVAPWLAQAAGTIAEQLGVSGTFVGTTLVAFTTSLPELVATVAAVRIHAYDLAIGNVFGSNTFNLLMLFPLDIFHEGPLFAALAPEQGLTCFAVVLVTAIVILGQLYRVEKRVLFVEPDAGLVIVLVIATLWMIYLAG